MNFNISKILHLAGTIFLISLSIISTLLAEVDDKNVNNPRGTTITNSSDGYAVDLDNGDSFTVINSGTISSSHTGDAVAVGLEDSSTLTNLTNNGTISGLSTALIHFRRSCSNPYPKYGASVSVVGKFSNFSQLIL